MGGGHRFLDRATPGAANAGGSTAAQVADVSIDRETGFYDSAVVVTMTCPTPGSQIRFTSDGTEPLAGSGTVYTGPFELSSQADHPTGHILREFWTGVPGANVSDFAYNTTPSSSTLHTPVEISFSSGENIANRMRGHVRPNVSGEFTFWISGNDSAELWAEPGLRQRGQATHRVHHGGDVLSRIRCRSQPAFGARHAASRGKYYIEALHKDATGADHVSVAWQGPGFARILLGGGWISAQPCRAARAARRGAPACVPAPSRPTGSRPTSKPGIMR